MRGVAVLLAVLIASPVSEATSYSLKPSKWPNANKIVVLKRPGDGQAAGCPIGTANGSTLRILTAKHVAEKGPLNVHAQDGRLLGTAKPVFTDPKRDLAIMQTDVSLPAIPIATEGPSKGDEVLIYGPVPQDKGGYADGVWIGEIVTMVDGLMGAWSGNGPGSSGSCVLSSTGAVLAINVGNLWWGQGGHVKQASLSEPIWGGWPK